ncbi:MAG: thiamine phosphate synthase [Leptospirales bacterium]
MYVTPDDIPVKLLVQRACDAVEGGVTAIQVRRKSGGSRELFDLAILLSESLPSGFPLIVNSRLDVAIEAGAWGLHLPEAHIRLSRFRDQPFPLHLGVSCHSVGAALNAQEEGAEYVIFGPIFDTPSKREFGPPQGVERLAAVVNAVNIPVIAIGGIVEATVGPVRRAGASGIAVMGALAYEEDARSAAFSLRRQWVRERI